MNKLEQIYAGKLAKINERLERRRNLFANEVDEASLLEVDEIEYNASASGEVQLKTPRLPPTLDERLTPTASNE